MAKKTFYPLDKITGLSHHMNIPRREGAWRWVSSPVRPFPDGIIIGAQKCGTTSLFYYLIQHPAIVGSQPKEVQFFDRNYHRGTSWYKAHFPLQPHQIKIEASPEYLFLPHIAKRIRDTVPSVKLIVLLRNPTDRAISSYFHQLRAGKETLPIMEALQKEEERTSTGDQALKNSDFSPNQEYLQFSYKRRGIYLEQLQHYWDQFSKENILILQYEKFAADPISIAQFVFQFLGVDSSYSTIDLKQYNVGINKQEVPGEVYDYLNEYFEPHNRALSAALEMEFDW
jgi:hypothetical protein